jgi:hypothetical protein
MFLLAFTLGAATGGTAVYCLTAVRKPQSPPQPPAPPQIDFYGHPIDLGEELAQRLPHIDGHLWERGIKFNDVGEPVLFLNLLDARALPATVVAGSSVNLRWRSIDASQSPHARFPWAADYAQFGAEYTADWARKEIVVPLLHWAQAQVDKHGGGDVERYGIQS